MGRNRVILVILLFVTGNSDAQYQRGEPRRPRPPPDYSARAVIHHTPVEVAPPVEPSEKKEKIELPPEISTRNPVAHNQIPLTAPAPPIDVPLREEPLFQMRRPTRDSLGGGDKPSQPPSWGWLAEEIATNRLRRAGNQDEREDFERDFIDRNTRDVIQPPAVRDVTMGQTNVELAARAATFEFRPVIDRGDRSVQTMKEDDLLADRPNRDIDRSISASVARDLSERRDSWAPSFDLSPPITPLSSDRGRADSVGAYSPALEEALRRTRIEREPETRAPSRPLFESPWPARAEVGSEHSAPSPTLGGLRSSEGLSPPSAFSIPNPSIWQSSSFTPLQIAPADLNPTPISSSMSPFNNAGSSPSTPSLGGMGTDHERMIPKTLPW